MEQEIKIGNKVYKEEEFYKLSDNQFNDIYKDVINMENDLIDNVTKQAKETIDENTVEQLELMSYVRSALKKVKQTRLNDKLNKSYEKNKIDSNNKVDKEYNNTLSTIKDSYSELLNSIDSQLDKLQEKKDRLLDQLIINVKENQEHKEEETPMQISEEQTPTQTSEEQNLEPKEAKKTHEKSEIYGNIVEEYMNKSTNMNILDEYTTALESEGEKNALDISKYFIDTAITPKNDKKQGIFTRFTNFVKEKILSKKLDERVNKEKDNKLKNVHSKIINKLNEAKEKKKNIKPTTERAIRATVAATFLSVAGIAGIATIGNNHQNLKDETLPPVANTEEILKSLGNNKTKNSNEFNVNIHAKEFIDKYNKATLKSNDKKEYDSLNFELMTSVADVDASTKQEDSIELTIRVDESKIANLLESKTIEKKKTKEIEENKSKNSKLTDEKVEIIIGKIVDINRMDKTDEEKAVELQEYAKNNEDGISPEDVSEVIAIYLTIDRKNSKLTDEKVEIIIGKIVDINRMDKTDEEKAVELQEYAKNNEDGISPEDISEVIAGYFTKGKEDMSYEITIDGDKEKKDSSYEITIDEDKEDMRHKQYRSRNDYDER